MFRFFVCTILILTYVSSQTTEDSLQFTTDFSETQSWQDESTTPSLEVQTDYDTTQSWEQPTTEQLSDLSTNEDITQSLDEVTTQSPFEVSTNEDATQSLEQITTGEPLEASTNEDTTQSLEQITTGEPLEASTNEDTTQTWGDFTTEGISEQDNFTTTTTTIQQMTSTMMTTTMSSLCQPNITCDISEETKQEIIDIVLRNVSREITNQLEAMEARLTALTCSTNNGTSAIKLSWQIYENLQVPLTCWLRVFDHPYSHKTRIDHLNQIAGICHNEILVGATFNKSIILAAVGPAHVLTIDTMWNQPKQFGQVYWYRSMGKSFGFSPNFSIRQTSADNEDLNSPLRLSWLLDQNMGGYRAGATRSINDDSLWRKIIYCN